MSFPDWARVVSDFPDHLAGNVNRGVTTTVDEHFFSSERHTGPSSQVSVSGL